ncbi:MAG TPA: hypothetical protein VGT40_26455 [Methylomirabilota bacterium]|nr:hypothetical protein [Methylomirabilota bacterium]
MSHEPAVLLRVATILLVVWLAGLGAVKLGRAYQALEHGDEPGHAPDDPRRLRHIRDSDVPAASVSAIVPSTLTAGAAATVRVTGAGLSGAFVTASAGIRVTRVQIDDDTLILQVFVDAAAPAGLASLTLVTASRALTVPITVVPGRSPPQSAAGVGAEQVNVTAGGAVGGPR